MTVMEVLPHLVHVGALFYVICFLFRDQFYLRLFAILGDAVYTAYFFSLAVPPFWAIFYALLNVAINIVMMVLILNDRRQSNLDDRDMLLYQSFGGMTPGDFRRVKNAGTWHTAEADTLLTTEAQATDQLHFILSGTVDISKAARTIPIEGRHFIGEIAYLQKAPASATVVAKPGCVYMTWSHEALASLSRRHDSLRQSLGSILSNDLANKVARA